MSIYQRAPLAAVALQDDFFAPRIATNRQVTIPSAIANAARPDGWRR